MNQAYKCVYIRPFLGEDMDVVVDQRMAFAQGQRRVEVTGI